MLNTIVEAITTCFMFLSKIIFRLTKLIVSKVKLKTMKLAMEYIRLLSQLTMLNILPNEESIIILALFIVTSP